MAAAALNRKHHAGYRFLPVEGLCPRPHPRRRLVQDHNGYVPPLASPTSFNEHIFVRKFFAPLPMPSLADKLAAKDYVKARVGDEFLPAVVWVGDDVDGLFAAKPPAGRYVLKANHGWSSNLFLNLPDDLSAKRDEIEQRAEIGSPPGSATIGASGNIARSSRSCFWRSSSISTGRGARRLQVLLFSRQGLSYRNRRRSLHAAANRHSIRQTGSTFRSLTGTHQSSAHGRAILRR